MNLTAGQIAQYAAAAGFAGGDLVTAVAIALAESNGNPAAYNPETAAGAPAGQGSVGLWQIFLMMHPEFAGEDLTDPQTNANAAYSIYSIAGGFTPWSTYTSGQYGMYETAAMVAQVQPGAAPAPVVAAAGQPVVSSTPTAALQNLFTSVSYEAAPSMTDVLLVGGLGLAALLLLEG
jgi:Lysozyme like domain